jgi:hypothetical protein
MIMNSTKVQIKHTAATDGKPPVMRCGSCLFAQGGDEFKFRNGETNFRYECTLRSRNYNIVFLDSQSEHYRWHNQKACEHFEGAGKSLKKRADLDHTKFDFLSDGHFEVLP